MYDPRTLALSCCGADSNLLISALGKGFGLAQVNPVPASLNASCTTTIGLGLGLNHGSLVSSFDSVMSVGHQSPSTNPHQSDTPSPGIGPGQTRNPDSPDPLTSSPSLNISFVNSSRFRKYAKHGETALLWYHPKGTPGYNIASLDLDASSSDIPPENQSPVPLPPSDDYLQHIPSKYHDYTSVFSPTEVDNLPPHRSGFDASIKIDESKTPPFGPIYRLSQPEHEALFTYIESNLKKGFIRRSTSPAAAPILFVKKKNGDLRLCIDYRGLNSITKRNWYPLPLIDDLLDRAQGCKVFSVLDLKNAFNLIRVKEGEEWKTAFRTHLGLFEYTVMPMGLTNAPSIFQAFIQDTLRDLLDVICVVYLDDILIFSRTQKDHDHHVAMVLERLQKAGLYANAKKCTFDQSEVEYLGYHLSADGVKMSPKKLDTISEWPVPKSVKDVQSFLGFTNFYRRFIDNYAKIVLPLNTLTHKKSRDNPFSFPPDALSAFETLKRAFTSSPVLRHFDPALPTTLSTDASDFAIAGIVHQPDEHGFLHPCAYRSRKLSPSEINYEIYDKELLAIIDSFRDFHAWLIGTIDPVSVVSDHKNLEYFMTSRVLNRRQARWSMFLFEFNFRLDYAPGIKNVSDSPSRRPDYAPREGDDVLKCQEKVLLTSTHTERLFRTSPTSSASSAISRLPTSAISVSAFTSLCIDNSELLKQFKEAYKNDTEWRDAKSHGNEDFQLEGNIVFHKGRVFVPSSLRSEILHSRHDALVAGHPGRARTLGLVSQDFSWPGMNTYVRKYVQACDVCARIKAPRHKPYGLLQPLDIPSRPWKSISMDFIVKLPISHGYDSIWVVCDRLTQAAHFIPTNETIDAPGLARLFLDRVFRYHGLPDSIVSDRGSIFVSQFWKELTMLLRINLRTSTAYHPQTDGLTERTNQTIEAYLHAFCSYQQDDWVDYLPLGEFAFNNNENSSTKQTPFFANYAFHPTFSPQLSGRTTDRQAKYYNRKVLDSPSYQPDQLVWLLRRNIKTTRPSNKLDHRRLGPFPVDCAISPFAYRLRLPSYLSRLHPVFHVSLLEPYSDPSDFHTHADPDPFLVIDSESPPISSILDSRKLGQRYEYLVHWKDTSPDEDSWLPLSDIPTLYNELLERFHRCHSRAPRPHQLLIARSVPTDTSVIPSNMTKNLPQPMNNDPSSSSALPKNIPRRSSPPPVPAPNLVNEYVPPTQTTTLRGCIIRPAPRLDPLIPGR
ncbi:hypothetical protein NLI96_g11201 [Meripilus lineatus]|uniref:Reverse transcriptase n=1 Tax=Meripilus lineatus TaxID=2056292 RepID=A0AAD5YDH9_9APHY|nr:hypothetical protein NLI96_g11201 [Physisporinus lineatus]